MDLRLLQYFIAVAELEHVGKAAERLHISQSPLSRQIRQLEQELGLDLFRRERQRLQLTVAGRWLLEEARELVAHAERVRSQAKLRSQGKAGTLRVSFHSPAMWSGVLPAALRRFQADQPEAGVELEQLRSSAQVERMRAGRIDVGFVSSPPEQPGFIVQCVSEERLLLVVPADHELAGRTSIKPADLANCRWILLQEAARILTSGPFLEACAAAGFKPEIARQVSEPLSLLALVGCGLGVALVRESTRNYASPQVALLPLPWLPFTARIYMIRPEKGQPLADTFAGYF